MCALVLTAVAGPAAAQAPWDSPRMLAPRSPAGLGLIVVDWGLDPGDGVGALLTWRADPAPGGAGFRAGAARGIDDDLIGVAGIDYSLPVLEASADFPLDLIWTVGAGASYGEYLQLAVPVGLAAGRSVESGTLWLNPYLSARVVFASFFGSDRPHDFRLGLAVDTGADIAIDRGRDFILRIGASLGDRPALAAGLHLRL